MIIIVTMARKAIIMTARAQPTHMIQQVHRLSTITIITAMVIRITITMTTGGLRAPGGGKLIYGSAGAGIHGLMEGFHGTVDLDQVGEDTTHLTTITARSIRMVEAMLISLEIRREE
jgi:hypothetical protein